MSSLTITFLGTGTSVGIPMVGCDCDVCTSDDPRNKRLRSSIYVEAPDCKFVVDSGPDFRQQCLREDIREVDAALFTHQHSDHIMGFDDLRRFSIGLDVTLPVYATAQCLAQVQAAFSFAFDKSNWFPGYIKPESHVVDGPFDLKETRVTPLPVTHGKVETIGYMFERDGRKLAAYIPDAKTISDEGMEALLGVECLIIDATKISELPTHMNVEEALAVRQQLLDAGDGPRETWLTHIADQIDHGTVEAGLPDGVKIAYDGLKLNLG